MPFLLCLWYIACFVVKVDAFSMIGAVSASLAVEMGQESSLLVCLQVKENSRHKYQVSLGSSVVKGATSTLPYLLTLSAALCQELFFH